MIYKNSESPRRAKNLKYLRISNRAEIIRCLSIQGPISRIELASQLGLTKMAISSIVSEMIEEGLVLEQGTRASGDKSFAILPGKIPEESALSENLPEESVLSEKPSEESSNSPSAGAGRRPSMLAIHAEQINALGLYLSRDAIEGVQCDVTGQIIRTWNHPLEEFTNADNYLTQMDEILDAMLLETAGVHVVGIGISSIGPLDMSAGRLLSPANFHGIHNLSLTNFVQRKCSFPVILDNDMNAAVQAEQLYGTAKKYRHVVYLGIGNGIGAGVISYGRIFQGSSGVGGELGHMSVNLDGPHCLCGNRGCLELYASIPVLLRQSGSLNIREMVNRAVSDPSSANVWLPRMMQALTTALVNIANIFDPEIILLGHQCIYLAPILLPELENEVNRHIIQREIRHIPIRIAAFGEKTPLVGAAALIFQAVFRGEIPVC
ncbi:MAG: ROK family transcriptional regulator [Eubacteriales bacterium]